MVLGDFNSLSPFDADLYDLDGPYITRLRENNKDKGEKGNVNHGNPDYSVMSAFLSFPLIDVCQFFTKGMSERGSFPGQVVGEVNSETKEKLITRLERIDFIKAEWAKLDLMDFGLQQKVIFLFLRLIFLQSYSDTFFYRRCF